MYIRNLVRFRRMRSILLGLIIINIITRFVIDINMNDNFSLISYLLVSIIWIDFVRVLSEEYVQFIDDEIRKES
jgi:c-di-AMP phosphodiesterase-like protein